MITVAIVTYRCNIDLERSLRSVIHETSGFSSEILIIDNCPDRSAQKLCEKLKVECEAPIYYVESKQNNIGLGRALAVQKARGEFIAFIDSDCVAPNGWLKKLFNFQDELLAKGYSVGAVGGGNCPPSKVSSFYDALILMRKVYWGHLNSAQMRLFPEPTQVDHLPTANVIYNRRQILNLGNFRSDLPNIGEDLDMSYRLQSQNLNLYYCPNVVVSHHEVDSLMDWALRAFRFGKAQVLVAFSNESFGFLNRRILLPIIFGGLLFGSIFCSAWQKSLLWIPVIYLCFIVFSSLVISILNRKIISFFYLVPLFVSAHCLYSLGEMIVFWQKGMFFILHQSELALRSVLKFKKIRLGVSFDSK